MNFNFNSPFSHPEQVPPRTSFRMDSSGKYSSIQSYEWCLPFCVTNHLSRISSLVCNSCANFIHPHQHVFKVESTSHQGRPQWLSKKQTEDKRKQPYLLISFIKCFSKRVDYKPGDKATRLTNFMLSNPVASSHM